MCIRDRFLDRWGKSWWLAASVVYSAGMIALIGLFPSYWMLLVFFGLAGLGSSLLHPLGSVASTRSAGSQPGLAISVYSTGGNLAYSLGPVSYTHLDVYKRQKIDRP